MNTNQYRDYLRQQAKAADVHAGEAAANEQEDEANRYEGMASGFRCAADLANLITHKPVEVEEALLRVATLHTLNVALLSAAKLALDVLREVDVADSGDAEREAFDQLTACVAKLEAVNAN